MLHSSLIDLAHKIIVGNSFIFFASRLGRYVKTTLP
jgi:hypothetical protein